MQNELRSRIQAWDEREGASKVSREQAHAKAAKARAAYRRRQVRDSALLFPFKVLLIAANIVLVPLMLAFAAAMLLLSPLFLIIAALRPLVLIGGLVTLIVGIVTVIGGGSPAALIVGAVLTVLALSVKVTYSNR